jgi:hypothetical protein
VRAVGLVYLWFALTWFVPGLRSATTASSDSWPVGEPASLQDVHLVTLEGGLFSRVSKEGELLDEIPQRADGSWVTVLTNSPTEFIFITATDDGDVFAQYANVDGTLGRRFFVGGGFVPRQIAAARNRTGFLGFGTRFWSSGRKHHATSRRAGI